MNNKDLKVLMTTQTMMIYLLYHQRERFVSHRFVTAKIRRENENCKFVTLIFCVVIAVLTNINSVGHLLIIPPFYI
jgi:hypothetical protein